MIALEVADPGRHRDRHACGQVLGEAGRRAGEVGEAVGVEEEADVAGTQFARRPHCGDLADVGLAPAERRPGRRRPGG